MLVLDLFCGTKSLKPVIKKKGWDYIGLDIEEMHNPDIWIVLVIVWRAVEDILIKIEIRKPIKQ